MNAQLIIDPYKAEIHINDTRIEHGRNQQELQEAILEALIIRAYMKAEISIGEVAEFTGKSVEEAMDWLNSEGVATTRIFRPETEAIANTNYETVAAMLGLPMNS